MVESQHAAYEASRAVLAIATARRDASWREAARDNRRRALVATTAPLLVAAVLMALGVVAPAFLAAGALLAILWAVVAVRLWRRPASRALRALGGVTTADATARGLISRAEAERLADVTEGLCTALGLAVPAIAIIDGHVPNALALGGAPDDATLVLTAGVPHLLDRIELEAVLAHELAHVKRRDMLTGALAATGLGAAGDLLSGGRFSVWLVGRDREMRADMAAVAVTRYPPGLISALERVAGLELTAASDRPAAPEGPAAIGLEPRPGAASSQAASPDSRAWRRVELSWLAPAPAASDRPGRRSQSEFYDRLDVLREL